MYAERIVMSKRFVVFHPERKISLNSRNDSSTQSTTSKSWPLIDTTRIIWVNQSTEFSQLSRKILWLVKPIRFENPCLETLLSALNEIVYASFPKTLPNIFPSVQIQFQKIVESFTTTTRSLKLSETIVKFAIFTETVYYIQGKQGSKRVCLIATPNLKFPTIYLFPNFSFLSICSRNTSFTFWDYHRFSTCLNHNQHYKTSDQRILRPFEISPTDRYLPE